MGGATNLKRLNTCEERLTGLVGFVLLSAHRHVAVDVALERAGQVEHLRLEALQNLPETQAIWYLVGRRMVDKRKIGGVLKK